MQFDADLMAKLTKVLHPADILVMLTVQLNRRLDALQKAKPDENLDTIEKGIGAAITLFARTLGAPYADAEVIGSEWRSVWKANLPSKENVP